MKDIYELLNDIDANGIEYIEMETTEIEKQKYKRNFRNSVKSKNKGYKKAIAAASLVAILGGVVSNETVWANVEKIWFSLQRVLELKNDEIVNYKYEINKSVESKNIKINYKNLMVDDGNLIIEMDIDDSKFDVFKDFTEKQQKDWNVNKGGNREKFISLGNIEAYVDGEKRGITQAGQVDFDKKSSDSNSVTSIVSIIPLNEIEGVLGIDEVGDNEFPYTIDKDKIYNIKLNTKQIHISAEMLEDEKVGYAGAVWSDWGVDIPIKGEDLVKATVNYDTYKIDKNIKINIDGVNKQLNINNLNVSPIYAKVNFTTDLDGYSIDDKYDIEIKLENEKGQEYQMQSMTPTYDEEKNTCNVVVQYRNIFRNSKKIKLTPVVINVETDEQIDQESIDIDLSSYN